MREESVIWERIFGIRFGYDKNLRHFNIKFSNILECHSYIRIALKYYEKQQVSFHSFR